MNPADLLEGAKGEAIAVVGDLMLDRFVWGKVSRISPEAPVPIVEIERESFHLGGAANVARNLESLGVTPLLLGLVGDDEPSVTGEAEDGINAPAREAAQIGNAEELGALSGGVQVVVTAYLGNLLDCCTKRGHLRGGHARLEAQDLRDSLRGVVAGLLCQHGALEGPGEG